MSNFFSLFVFRKSLCEVNITDWVSVTSYLFEPNCKYEQFGQQGTSLTESGIKIYQYDNGRIVKTDCLATVSVRLLDSTRIVKPQIN
jgi:hypothetical protein